MPLRSLVATLTAGLAAAAVTLAAAGPVHADAPRGHACSSAVAIERYSDALDKTTYAGTFVGNLSGLAVDRDGSLLAVSDRSALFTLDRRTLAPRGVLPLTTETGAALDAEALAVDRDGTRIVTSETEPSLRRYDRRGRILGSLPVPDALRVAPAGRAVANQTFEGLTLLPGGRILLASMEGALAGDGAGVVRLQTWQRHGGTGDFGLSAQYGYRADPGLGVVEVAGLPGGRLLVLERGFTAGVGNTVRLYAADTRRATDTAGVAVLTGQEDDRAGGGIGHGDGIRSGGGTGHGGGVRLVRKTLLADLVNCPSLGATAKQPQPNPLLDNIEGMTVTGAARAGGRLEVLLVSDDNQNAVQTTRLYALRVRVA
ncbi:esterase-like activity of phytase family protein [Streptomyces caniscabiei]|uniref:esterase-like activity of phytase family protein n=1 Tax=Streptomyces caniscabiei TaxID=2746961 RepID=UPI0029AAEC47|nr:esterase-like activity of phytase family protein [Streptomyces caniscabiei]MDX2598464.1 esterase-like activity of phytase family protein [Streptomyces caniscabiei]MDX2740963.1 esterase-like activity of phytase family protein [Streptomyces caniscabiei]MDX2780546.1 esterase-like activity of phytase family protein [Streptomyces caniscabiei]